jgi:hypothetical protein
MGRLRMGRSILRMGLFLFAHAPVQSAHSWAGHTSPSPWLSNLQNFLYIFSHDFRKINDANNFYEK